MNLSFKLSNKQLHALSKRIADAMEKLSIGGVGYWIFQDKASGLGVGLICIVVSLVITVMEAR